MVLDTNIIVSALLFSGEAAKIHEAWVDGRLHLILSEAILTEYRRVLGYRKFGLTQEEATRLLEEEVQPFGEIHVITQGVQSWIPEDPSDDKFIALAIEARAECLASGDSHILSRRDSLPLSILSLSELLEKLAAEP
ncbi:MAG: putative toxin-antitoxin system toxin component, PIN family [Spirochaetota bacterium]